VRALLVVALVTIPASAHAMGYYEDLTIVAWSSDGRAVLVTRDESSSATAGARREYVVVGIDHPTPVVVAFDDTTDEDTATQHIDVATCQKNARILKKALAANHFRGVAIHAGQCKGARAVVAISKAAADAVTAADLGELDQRRSRTDFEDIVAGKLTDALGALPFGDVASATGDLVLVLDGEDGAGGGPTDAKVIADGKVLVDDLR
jgi:hypothetical protein